MTDAGAEQGPAGPSGEQVAAGNGPASWGIGVWAWLAAAVAVVVYIPSLWNGFAFDDLPIIVENDAVTTWGSLGHLLTQPYWPFDNGAELGLWRPTTSVVLAALWQIGGGTAFLFHAVNVALHATVSFLVVRVTSKVVAVPVAGLAGVFFALHPVHVEAVANGVGIAELLAAAFVLSALWIAVRRDRLGAGSIALVCLLFALGFGAKEGAVVLPGLIFVVDAVRDRLRWSDFRSWVTARGPLMAGLAAVAGVMLWARSQILVGVASTMMPPMGGRLLTEVPRVWTLGEIWYQTVRVLTLPTWLSPEYSPNVIPVGISWSPRGIAGMIVVLAALSLALLAAWRMRRRGAAERDRNWEPGWEVGVAFGVVWLVVAISPVSNVPFLTGVLLAERTLYLPSIGVVVAIASLVGAPLLRRNLGPPVRIALVSLVGFLVLAWTTLTITYTPVWRSNATLFEYMVRTVPESGRSQFFMGDHLLTTGDEAGALMHYRLGLRLADPESDRLIFKGGQLLEAGELRAARLLLIRAAVAAPTEPRPRQLLAVVSLRRQDWALAERWARATVELDPADVTAWFILSTARAEQEKWEAAAEAHTRLAALDPGPWQPWFAVAEYRARADQVDRARAAADSVRGRTGEPETLQRLDSLLTALGAGSGG